MGGDVPLDSAALCVHGLCAGGGGDSIQVRCSNGVLGWQVIFQHLPKPFFCNLVFHSAMTVSSASH